MSLGFFQPNRFLLPDLGKTGRFLIYPKRPAKIPAGKPATMMAGKPWAEMGKKGMGKLPKTAILNALIKIYPVKLLLILFNWDLTPNRLTIICLISQGRP